MLGADGRPTEPTVNRALLETQLLASSWVAIPPPPDAAAAVRERVALLFSDPQFVDAIQRATGDRSRTLTRARCTVAAFVEAGAQMNVPYDLNA